MAAVAIPDVPRATALILGSSYVAEFSAPNIIFPIFNPAGIAMIGITPPKALVTLVALSIFA